MEQVRAAFETVSRWSYSVPSLTNRVICFLLSIFCPIGVGYKYRVTVIIWWPIKTIPSPPSFWVSRKEDCCLLFNLTISKVMLLHWFIHYSHFITSLDFINPGIVGPESSLHLATETVKEPKRRGFELAAARTRTKVKLAVAAAATGVIDDDSHDLHFLLQFPKPILIILIHMVLKSFEEWRLEVFSSQELNDHAYIATLNRPFCGTKPLFVSHCHAKERAKKTGKCYRIRVFVAGTDRTW